MTLIDSQFVQNIEIWLVFVVVENYLFKPQQFQKNVGRYLMEKNKEATYHNCQINKPFIKVIIQLFQSKIVTLSYNTHMRQTRTHSLRKQFELGQSSLGLRDTI